MNAQQAQTPQEGLSGKGSHAIAREEPLQQPDQPPTSMRETPRTTPQAIQLPPSTAPVRIEETNQAVEDQHLQEDAQPQDERAQQENGNDEAPQEPEEPVQAQRHHQGADQPEPEGELHAGLMTMSDLRTRSSRNVQE